MSPTPSSADHRWDRVSAKDHARVHNGHSYGGPVYNVHNYAPNLVDDEEEERREKAWRADLLTWLKFAEIDNRRAQVKDAYDETYSWIFQDGNETGFAEWLGSSKGIFWINGKPASGKSTLMKFIADEPRLRRLLRRWTGKTPLVVSCFWFWAAGTPLQRSLIGLYRSLLVQILKTDHCLYRVAFPDWEVKFNEATPTMEMLSTAMNNLLGSEALSTNFCFIMDGLDEYDRNSIGKTELAALILDFTKCSRVKCILSSRPETPFKIAFQQFPCLRLETLTKPDICIYVEARLWSNPTLRKISAAERRTIQEIENFIVTNAQGVFLWVALVLNVALDSINSYDDFSAIRDRIMDLPPELDSLFDHIMTRRIEPRHKEEAFRYLLIALRFRSKISDASMDHTILAGAQQASGYETACRIVKKRNKKEFQGRLSTNTQRAAVREEFANILAGRCQGLLECTVNGASHSITFCHKTLFDYLNEQQEARRLLESTVGSSFDLDTAIMVGIVHKAWLYELDVRAIRRTEDDAYRKSARKVLDSSCERLQHLFYRFNMLAEACTGQDRRKIVEAFDRCLSNPDTFEIRQLTRRKPFEGFGTDLHPHICRLANVAFLGSTLHLKSAIEGHEVSGTGDLTLMLYYATKSIICAKQGAQDTGPRTEQPDNPLRRLEICTVLLGQGADPAHDIHGLCPWKFVIENMRVTRMMDKEVVPQLRTLLILLQHAPDVRKCRDIVSQYGNF